MLLSYILLTITKEFKIVKMITKLSYYFYAFRLSYINIIIIWLCS